MNEKGERGVARIVTAAAFAGAVSVVSWLCGVGSAPAGAGEASGPTAGAAGAPAVESRPPAAAPVSLPVERAALTPPPRVPPAIQRTQPARVQVDLEVREHVGRMADGVEYAFWTFGGTVPGSFIRIRQGDEVEFRLSNHPDNKMPHNIDLHAVTGPGGGAAASFTAPGHTSVFSFKALNAGLYVYHCATAPVGMHIANGMYGLILVEPEGGLPRVDREYYVMQGDFYTRGRHGEAGLQPFDMEKALDEKPEYVVFNGSVGALTGDKAITARTGETVRLYLGNGGPNLISSFHVIGEIFDLVYQEGGGRSQTNVQTTLIPAGGSAIVEFKVDVPGTYILVDHSIFRTFNKGALGMLKVEGKEDTIVYSGRQDDRVYQPEGGAVQAMPGVAAASAPPPAERTSAERATLGAQVYGKICAACHQPSGLGIPKAFPPIAKSDFLMADKVRSIKVLLHGLEGPVTVNGEAFNSVMPSLGLDDDTVANVLTYVRSSFGNGGDAVTAAEVAKVRAAGR